MSKAKGRPIDQPVGRQVLKRTEVCPHCNRMTCLKGGGYMSGYWVIDAGCDKARAAKGLPPFRPWYAA